MSSGRARSVALWAIVGLVAVLPFQGFTAFLNIRGIVIPTALGYVLFALCLPSLPAVVAAQPRATWWFIATYALGTAIALYFSLADATPLSSRVFTTWQQLALMALVTYGARQPGWGPRLLKVFLASLAAVFAVYLALYALNIEVHENADRVRRVANYHTNIIGRAAALGLLLALTTLAVWERRTRWWLLVGLVPTAAAVLLLANSRGAFLGLGCGILVFCVPGSGNALRRWPRRLALVTAVALFVAAFAATDRGGALLARPAERWIGLTEYTERKESMRAKLLAATATLAVRHPMGLGTGNSGRELARLIDDGAHPVVDAHSDFSTALLECGILGLLFSAIGFWHLGRAALARARQNVLWPATMLAAVVAMSMFHTTGLYKIRWIVLGLLAAIPPAIALRRH